MFKRIVILLASVLAALALTALPAAAATGGGQITTYGGKCVDVAGANTADGTPVQMYDCNSSNAQLWTVSGSTVQALGKCMDVTGANSTNGTKVQLYTCNGTNAQQWTLGADGTMRALGKCLDDTGWNTGNGTQLQIWDCTGNANQNWNAPGTGSGIMAVAPYYYNGWGSPPDPTTIMSATGVKWFTMAFILSNGYCTPAWDGSRPLTGGVDQNTVNIVRGAGGDILPSFGGAGGTNLETSCNTAGELANAYQTVINTYRLKAIDIDIEGTTYSDATIQQKVVDALKIVKANNPGFITYVTFPSGTSGPDGSMISKGASSGLTVDSWTIMPFDFPAPGQNMANLTMQATDGLKNTLRTYYGYTDDQAYRHSGISSMNGITDANEVLTLDNFRVVLGYAGQHHLARLTFWSDNRDRPCSSTYPNNDTCSGVAQQPWAYTQIFADYWG
jgi:Ricin-type beta-trefoil lectin domain